MSCRSAASSYLWLTKPCYQATNAKRPNAGSHERSRRWKDKTSTEIGLFGTSISHVPQIKCVVVVRKRINMTEQRALLSQGGSFISVIPWSLGPLGS